MAEEFGAFSSVDGNHPQECVLSSAGKWMVIGGHTLPLRLELFLRLWEASVCFAFLSDSAKCTMLEIYYSKWNQVSWPGVSTLGYLPLADWETEILHFRDSPAALQSPFFFGYAKLWIIDLLSSLTLFQAVWDAYCPFDSAFCHLIAAGIVRRD